MPAARDSDVGRLSATLAVTERHHGPDHPHVHELRRDLHTAQAAAYIKALVDSTPPLTAEQKLHLTRLLSDPRPA